MTIATATGAAQARPQTQPGRGHSGSECLEGIGQRAPGREDLAEQRGPSSTARRIASARACSAFAVRATQPAAHGARGQGQLSGDRPVPAPAGLGQQRAEDDGCRVRAPRGGVCRQQDVRGRR